MILDPDALVKKLLLADTACIADLGAGSGIFTIAAARCARNGTVYSIDIQSGLLPLIIKNVDARGINNVEVIVGDIEEVGGTKLKDSAVDAVILANTLFQAREKRNLVKEIQRILKPGGKLLLVDWAQGPFGVGPRREEIVSPETTLKLFSEEGFSLKEEVPAGEHHYGMIFLKNKTI